jgi:hypothetical protein
MPCDCPGVSIRRDSHRLRKSRPESQASIALRSGAFRQTGAQTLSGGFAITGDSVEYCCDVHAPTGRQSSSSSFDGYCLIPFLLHGGRDPEATFQGVPGASIFAWRRWHSPAGALNPGPLILSNFDDRNKKFRRAMVLRLFWRSVNYFTFATGICIAARLSSTGVTAGLRAVCACGPKPAPREGQSIR